MSVAFRPLSFIVLLIFVAPAVGQFEIRRDLEVDPIPQVLPPPRVTEATKNHYQALRLYLRGQCLERDSRLVEAAKVYEEAIKLEPEALGLYKALIPLCFELDRDSQALEFCQKVLAMEPDNHELLFRYGCELQERGRLEEAADALGKAVRVRSLQEHPPQLAQVSFTLGAICEELKQYDKAAAAFEQVVEVLDAPEGMLREMDMGPRRQIEQEAARTYERLGRVQVRAKQYDKAVVAFQKAQQRDPLRAGRLHMNLAEVYIAKKELNTALEHLQKFLATQPGGAEPYEMLIDVLTQMKRSADILPILEASAGRDPFNQSLKMLLAGQYVKANQPKKAESLYLAAMNDYPSEEAYRGLAQLYQQQGRWTELVQKLDGDMSDPRHLPSARQQVQVLMTDTELVKGMASAALLLPQGGQGLAYQTRRVMATLCRQSKQYDLAEHFCRKCLADDPQPGEVYLELCRVLSEAGKFDAEAAVCREALTRMLKVPAMMFQIELARALALAGKDREAIEAAQQAVKQARTETDEPFQAQYTLAVVLYRGHHVDQAISECKKLLEKAHDARGQRQVHYLLSTIYTTQKNFPKAEEALQKVLEIDPEDAVACNDLGYIWADQGKNLEEAEKLIRKALDRDRAARQKKQGTLEKSAAEEDNAAYVDSLGWVLYRQGKLDEACKELERACRLATEDDPVLWDHLGEVYYDLGHRDKARQSWEKAVQMYQAGKRPGQDDRQQVLEDKLKILRAGATGKKQ